MQVFEHLNAASNGLCFMSSDVISISLTTDSHARASTRLRRCTRQRAGSMSILMLIADGGVT